MLIIFAKYLESWLIEHSVELTYVFLLAQLRKIGVHGVLELRGRGEGELRYLFAVASVRN